MSDLIRRQDALSCFHDWIDKYGDFHTADEITEYRMIEQLASAEPEPEEFEWCTDCKEYDQTAHCCHRWTKVIRQTVAEIKAEQKWIPCSERLPENGEIVLATHLGGLDLHRQVIEHIYDHGEFLLNWEMDMDMLSPTFGQRYMGDVIAWMPLPKPYREEGEDNA